MIPKWQWIGTFISRILGNYKVAHGILFNTYKDLEVRNIKIPLELKLNLMLLHSYVLAKVN
jgi:WD repeat-containing protein 19